MKKIQRKVCWGWKFGLLSGVAIGLAFFFGDSAVAQRRPVADDTLGDQRSRVRSTTFTVPTGQRINGELIEGGLEQGGNLFHSFEEFGVKTGRAVYFDNPEGIRNILSRVTGGTASEIFGWLGVLGDANLFLLNPNGIIFGRGARLNVGGSFVATTANAIQFGDQGFFSASEPSAVPLLTVDPSAFVFNQINAAQITNNAQVRTEYRNSPNSFIYGLRVPNEHSLLLAGGNIVLGNDALNEGRLNALSGRVEIAAIAGIGTVGLNVNDDILNLVVPDGLARADVSLFGTSRIDVRGDGTGSIAITASNVEISSSSTLRAGTRGGLATTERLGDITINATGEVRILEASNKGSSGIPTLVDLPADVVDASNQIVQACPTGEDVAESQNEFVITGRGGLPPTPQDVLSGEAIQVGLVTSESSPREEAGEFWETSSASTSPSPIAEAQGWVVDENGDVVLIASAPESSPPRLGQNSVNCPAN